MTASNTIADAAERARALDGETSFLVQAPAGSGKTELLIQRFLVLLGRVQWPEEIVAVTFTRKAAGEMRHRILKALEAAAGPEPGSPHARLTWSLARAALERDTRLGWNLVRYPQRLRVTTIDALCASITRQMPRLAGFGASPGVAENASDLYREAARRTLVSLEDGGLHSDCVARLLIHLDTNFDRVERLLVAMLGARDQWLRHVLMVPDPEDSFESEEHDSDDVRPARRRALEGALQAVVNDALNGAAEAFPSEHAAVTVRLARSAAANLVAEVTDPDANPIVFCADLPSGFFNRLPSINGSGAAPGEPMTLNYWLGVAHLLLTRDGGWRSKCDKSIGFHAPSGTKDTAEKALRTELKEAFGELIGNLSDGKTHSGELLRHRLHALRSLPSIRYQDSQWEILEALVALLPVAVAHLRLVFQARGEVDFTEVAMRASEALGTEEAPTDLALALDYRIHHLLVDEFQDTSLGQYRLLERLTAGWDPGDGRTLFLVGDPMQSIYRFREAEVGLFLRAAAEGYLGGVPLEFLRLKCNFRSDGRIVEWVNTTFEGVLPAAPDALTGSVPYSASTPARPADSGERITVHPLLRDDPEAEAQRVVELVRANRNGKTRVAILVRSRPHLLSILPALREAGLLYRALDIDPLAGRPAVQDLLALTRALVHPADRIAWLAVLRAPWCGLSADDLHALASMDTRAPLWDLIRKACGLQESDLEEADLLNSGEPVPEPDPVPMPEAAPLSRDGLARLRRTALVLSDALRTRCRPPLRRWVEGTWLALGGPACVRDAADLADAREYLDLLDELDDGGDLTSFDVLSSRLQSLYALPDPEADGTLQIMTVHKAKGLEFDVVILPGLGRTPARDQKRLLLWAELPELSSPHKLLLAPIEETGRSRDPIYSFIWSIHRDKGAYEAGRVLYVAATRAREHLHLIGHAVPVTDKDGTARLRPPAESTMLGLLWPAVESHFREAFAAQSGEGGEAAEAQAGEAHEEVPALAGAGRPDPMAAARLVVRRLPSAWTAPPLPPETPVPAFLHPAAENLETKVQHSLTTGAVTRHIGTVVHRWLRMIATAARRDGRLCDEERLLEQRGAIRSALAQLGVGRADLDGAAEQVLRALIRTVTDDRGAWLLDAGHAQAAVNLTVTGVHEGRIVSTTIDRTFIDGQGVRWIIDYKAAMHEGGGLERFLDAQLRMHQKELELQAALFRAWQPAETNPLRTALYFPHLAGWREGE